MNSDPVNSDDELKQRARAKVKAMLRRAIPIRATTLAEAVAEAEKIKTTENILVGINSLWAWYMALPKQEQEAIGVFKNARHFWMKAIFQHSRK